MLKCPFCHFENEDGALFCEQCKSDLAGVAAAGGASDIAVAQVVEAMPIQGPGGDVPVAAVVEATPVVAEADLVAVAEPVAEMHPAALPAEPITPTSPLPAEPAPTAPEPAAAAPAAAPPAAAPAAAPPAAQGAPIPADAQVRLLVLRGL